MTNDIITAADITFDKLTTFDGVQECFMVADGENVGTISRERPCRCAVSVRDPFTGLAGMARDMTQGYEYIVYVDGAFLDIADGANLRDVKKAMIAAYLAR